MIALLGVFLLLLLPVIGGLTHIMLAVLDREPGYPGARQWKVIGAEEGPMEERLPALGNLETFCGCGLDESLPQIGLIEAHGGNILGAAVEVHHIEVQDCGNSAQWNC